MRTYTDSLLAELTRAVAAASVIVCTSTATVGATVSAMSVSSTATASSTGSAYRALPAAAALSTVGATSQAVTKRYSVVAALSSVSVSSQVSSVASSAVAARSSAVSESDAYAVLGDVIGDAQQPLPRSGLALTLNVIPGQSGQALFPAALYDSYPFNSFAVVDGVAYGAGPSGLHALAGGTETFTTRVHLGRRDFGSRVRKNVRQVGVGRVSGVADVVISADAGTVYKYRVVEQRGVGRLERACVGRGLIGTTIELEIRGDNALCIEAVEVITASGVRH